MLADLYLLIHCLEVREVNERRLQWLLEQIGIMTGDRVDMVGAFIDNTKPVPKNKKAEVDLPLPTPAPVIKLEDNKTAEATVEVPQI